MKKLFLLLFLMPSIAFSMTIGIDPPNDGTSYSLQCVKIVSIKLIKNGDVMWGGLPTWKSEKGSIREEECPISNGNWIEVKTELHRNYLITVRVIKFNKEGEVLSDRTMSPYAWFERGEKLKAPVILSI